MAFGGISYLAVAIAAVVSWLVGAAWYTALARPWMVALGKTRAELMGPSGKPSPVPFVVSFLAELVMAVVLAAIIGPGATVLVGIASGVLVWLGFVATTVAVNHGFAGARPMLTLIDGGHWLAVLVAQGAVIGLIGR